MEDPDAYWPLRVTALQIGPIIMGGLQAAMKFHDAPIPRFIVSRLLWGSRLSRFVIIHANGYRLRFHPSSVSAAVYCNPNHFQEEEALLRRILRPSDCFIDVGANIGVLSLSAAQVVGETGKVVAIEAHPRIFGYLEDNIRLNNLRNVRLINSAVGNWSGQVYFSDRRSDDQNCVADDGLRVRMAELDELLPNSAVRLLKIDVEGFELMVLQGAKRVLSKTDFVLFESWEQRSQMFGYSTLDVLAFLSECGFRADLPSNYKSPRCENLLAYK